MAIYVTRLERFRFHLVRIKSGLFHNCLPDENTAAADRVEAVADVRNEMDDIHWKF
jgi:hypothetical protein